MKIRAVGVNGRRRCFEMDLLGKGRMDFPFVRAEPPPGLDDPVVDAAVDPELADEGVVYHLKSGAEGVILADQVLDYHKDPA